MRRFIGKGSESIVYGSEPSNLVVKIIISNQDTVSIAKNIVGIFPNIFDVKYTNCQCGKQVTLVLMERMAFTLEQLKSQTNWKLVKTFLKEQTINVVTSLHSQGYLMGDAELCNFMVGKEDHPEVKIVDFGRIIKCNEKRFFEMEIDQLKLKFY